MRSIPMLFFPSNDVDAVVSYARDIDRHRGALAAWAFLITKGFKEEQIVGLLSVQGTAVGNAHD